MSLQIKKWSGIQFEQHYSRFRKKKKGSKTMEWLEKKLKRTIAHHERIKLQHEKRKGN